jgi:starch-binding outer membrane protein, SusD/RagB family
MKVNYKLLLLSIITLIAIGCKKNLEKKPNSNLQIPNNPDELQALLDNQEVFGLGHTLGLLSADEFYVSTAFYYGSLLASDQKAHIWTADMFNDKEIPSDWKKAYEQIYYSNIILEALVPLTANATGDRELNNIKGDALYKRAFSNFHLAELFAPAYDPAGAATQPGIPLKLTTDVDEVIKRPSLKVCFQNILSDLNAAKDLLSDKFDPSHKNRASKAAVTALLARIHLYMGNWHQSVLQAEAALKSYSNLIDFHSLDTSLRTPIKTDNVEVIYSMKLPDKGAGNELVVTLASLAPGANVDTSLISSFSAGDLRLPIFYRHRDDKTWGLRSGLTGTRTPFAGICTPEIYLSLAEAEARQGNAASALNTLNKLLVNRYDTGHMPPLPDPSNSKAVLEMILAERKKEMAFRGTRWLDIKRLNIQNPTITQTRVIDGIIYTIGPNDVRYALPLPAATAKKYGF